MLSEWGLQTVKGRRDRVEVTTTLPSPSPEYIRSLSGDIHRAEIAPEWERSKWVGAGGGGGRDISVVWAPVGNILVTGTPKLGVTQASANTTFRVCRFRRRVLYWI